MGSKLDNFEEGAVNPISIITNAVADTNTAGSDITATKALIIAPSTNVGIVWVNFQAAAVESECLPLSANGVLEDISLENLSQINALFKTANDKLIVIYKS